MARRRTARTASKVNELNNNTNDNSKTNDVRLDIDRSKTAGATKRVPGEEKSASNEGAGPSGSGDLPTAVPAKRRKTGVAADDVTLDMPRGGAVGAVGAPGLTLASGTNDAGQIGQDVNTVDARTRPQVVKAAGLGGAGGAGSTPLMVRAVVAGAMHSACITTNHMVYTYGCDDEGALGRGPPIEEEASCVPGPVVASWAPRAPRTPVVQVACGESHTALLTQHGHVYYTGSFRDNNGRFGEHRDAAQWVIVREPTRLECPRPARKIVSGLNHIVVQSVGPAPTVYTLGDGSLGQLGRVGSYFAERGGRRGAALLLRLGALHLPRAGTPHPVVTDVHAGGGSTYITMSHDTTLACGLNSYGQLGLEELGCHYMPTVVDSMKGKRWSKVCASEQHALMLDDQGEMYSLGSYLYGKLGQGAGHTADVREPTRVTLPAEELQPHPAAASTSAATPSPTKVVDIAVGSYSSYAVTNKGHVYAWGFPVNWAGPDTDLDDVWSPCRLTGKQLENRSVVAVSAGSQHLLLKAVDEPLAAAGE